MMLDITKCELPSADLILCRDLMVHFSFDDIHRALANIKASNIRYLLTTTFPETTENEDIVTGMWRPIDLQKPPFDLPVPIRLIDENAPIRPGAPVRDKRLGLWEISALR